MTPEIMFFYSIIVIVAGVILLFFFRLLIRFPRAKKNHEEKDSSQVGFVVDTFHEVVSQLKEKEKELEVLRKQAEDRATAIEGYNENILQSVQSGVVSLDEEMKVTKINLAAAKILEIKGESVIGQYHDEVLNKPITDFLQDKKVIERGEISYVTPSGKRIWLGLTLSPLKNNEGATIGQILIFTDLTHLKAIESQMELRNKLSSLGEISAGIAHELRNPMGVIAGYTKLLSKKADDALRPTVDAISREIVVMDRIISDFLSFARPVELNLADIDLKAIIEYCVMSTAQKHDYIDLQLETDNLPLIKGDEVLMRQAFINLIQNSLEAMPQRGKLIIRVSSASGDFLDITVADTGHGISENVKDKIFLPFFTTKEKGTGLGLAIVHKIVISHGGSIHVDSSEKGTVFRLRLPVRTTQT
ncbi:MAG TPA: ATP-binding protein [Thermodesulfovibrionales bacterium]|nr:ATP-binding protein [Thermodesulfovibrionales bacterium]